ncbi:acyl-CoA dehydrogenase family protein [Cupriavidus consociatus]|uniref:acyl-CoA dehydrogenase family protein n=1 Tax=Cupriavidus consociatus TaxID=2821357 RepID=UPI001AE22672|nr:MULTISPECIES: acyl-CoA dehydrogenase family protein [unclassified Cupriavidus]MBP0622317.1 acyl-CoA/acyl-ACP dehydrogenase [Cupriavidus sp. LEh25]MDK2658998.1 acyl-CoA dehydrogenase family protein [Cupriavidus sp. LEh21]
MDFTLPAPLQALRQRTATFIRDEILPFEADPGRGAHGPTEALRVALNARAREAGLLAPHVGEQWGGLGLSHLGRAVVFEEAGYSLLGPLALHCAAPDEGNMHLLEAVATPAQKTRWLRPLAAAEIRSCFCMTEPHPGAGSDPALLQTTAERDGDGYVIHGHKWLITGADGAGFAIVMARVPGEGGGPTMFLTDLRVPGIRIGRIIDSIDQSFAGGHAEVFFEGCRVGPDQVLGEVGQGLRYAQVRLAPARLTHCMRWLGAARRAHDIATAHALERHAFGKPIGEHEGVGFMLADNEIDMHLCRLSIWHTAWLLDQGLHARHESSMAKVFCAEAIFRVADRCMQVLGGLGVTRDTVVEQIFREARAFRIYDGPSEVHRWAIARRVLRTEAA